MCTARREGPRSRGAREGRRGGERAGAEDQLPAGCPARRTAGRRAAHAARRAARRCVPPRRAARSSAWPSASPLSGPRAVCFGEPCPSRREYARPRPGDQPFSRLQLRATDLHEHTPRRTPPQGRSRRLTAGRIEHPPARLRRLPGPARRDRAGRRHGARGGLPSHRHGGRLPQRGRRSGSPSTRAGWPATRCSDVSKCFNDDQGYEQARRALPREPRPARARLPRPVPDPLAGARPRPLRRDLEGLHRASRRGPDRAIGVSNFKPAHSPGDRGDRRDAGRSTRSSCIPTSSRPACAASTSELGIVTEAWSPLAQGAVLDDPVITEIAETTGARPRRS